MDKFNSILNVYGKHLVMTLWPRFPDIKHKIDCFLFLFVVLWKICNIRRNFIETKQNNVIQFNHRNLIFGFISSLSKSISYFWTLVFVQILNLILSSRMNVICVEVLMSNKLKTAQEIFKVQENQDSNTSSFIKCCLFEMMWVLKNWCGRFPDEMEIT